MVGKHPMKKIGFNLASLRETRTHEYVARFVFGGLCTAIAGVIAKRYGPGIGGLFLAFPAIFPASATMIESNEKRKKSEIGADGTIRGRLAASIDARGASLGSMGLASFGLVIWQVLPRHSSVAVIAIATVIWAIVSYSLWTIVKT
jgi:hypothetical protein